MIEKYYLSFDKSLVENIYKLKETDLGVKHSNVGGWHSKNFNQSPEWFQSYADAICQVVNQDIHSFWFNINDPGHSNKWHTHGNQFNLIGVWYLMVPKDSGNLEIDMNNNIEIVVPYPTLFVVHRCGINHRVTENRSSQSRISVAFNFK